MTTQIVLSILSIFIVVLLGKRVEKVEAFVIAPVTRSAFSSSSSALSTAATETSKSSSSSSSLKSILIDHAKDIDKTLQFSNTGSSSTKATGTYAPSGWSNRLGTVLTPASGRIYTADRPFYWNNIDVGGRMTVIQLPPRESTGTGVDATNDDDNNGGNYDLWIHSPIDLDETTKLAVDRLGTVKYVVSPNYEHLKYAEQWHKSYPDAFMWGCPGLAERLPNIQWEGEIPANIGVSTSSTSSPTNCWDFNELVPLHLNFEVNPFTGRPFFNEVIFFHRPTKALITTDVFWNYPGNGIPYPNGSWELAPAVDSIPIGSRLWKFGMDQVYLPFFKNLMVRDKDSYLKMVSTVLNDWQPELIIPCHGDLVRGKDVVRSILTDHFST